MNPHALLCVAAFLLSACGASPEPDPSGWTQVNAVDLNGTQRDQRTRGLAAKDDVVTRLMAELKQAFAEGPDRVVGVCHAVAPGVAGQAAAAHGVRLGRTSFKLRNPLNKVPAWATGLVAKRTAKPAWLAHADGRFAALLPIHMASLCLRCHGDPGSIAAPIRAELNRLYPKDEAKGFAEGSLRGWFWFEVPAP